MLEDCLASETQMIITYQNGLSLEGVALSRTDSTMRVAFRDQEDPVDFSLLNGAWVSEDCEPVTIQFVARRAATPTTEEECICAPDLAARLIAMLHTDSEEEFEEPRATKSLQASASLLA
ncbi:MAG TPA: hypothetical protein VN736_19325 [Candidatus Limnocylindrales bacterium]|nr:hypothetical protein [Candidatus Limnocylindrales bacterium]